MAVKRRNLLFLKIWFGALATVFLPSVYSLADDACNEPSVDISPTKEVLNFLDNSLTETKSSGSSNEDQSQVKKVQIVSGPASYDLEDLESIPVRSMSSLELSKLRKEFFEGVPEGIMGHYYIGLEQVDAWPGWNTRDDKAPKETERDKRVNYGNYEDRERHLLAAALSQHESSLEFGPVVPLRPALSGNVRARDVYLLNYSLDELTLLYFIRDRIAKFPLKDEKTKRRYDIQSLFVIADVLRTFENEINKHHKSNRRIRFNTWKDFNEQRSAILRSLEAISVYVGDAALENFESKDGANSPLAAAFTYPDPKAIQKKPLEYFVRTSSLNDVLKDTESVTYVRASDYLKYLDKMTRSIAKAARKDYEFLQESFRKFASANMNEIVAKEVKPIEEELVELRQTYEKQKDSPELAEENEDIQSEIQELEQYIKDFEEYAKALPDRKFDYLSLPHARALRFLVERYGWEENIPIVTPHTYKDMEASLAMRGFVGRDGFPPPFTIFDLVQLHGSIPAIVDDLPTMASVIQDVDAFVYTFWGKDRWKKVFPKAITTDRPNPYFLIEKAELFPELFLVLKNYIDEVSKYSLGNPLDPRGILRPLAIKGISDLHQNLLDDMQDAKIIQLPTFRDIILGKFDAKRFQRETEHLDDLLAQVAKLHWEALKQNPLNDPYFNQDKYHPNERIAGDKKLGDFIPLSLRQYMYEKQKRFAKEYREKSGLPVKIDRSRDAFIQSTGNSVPQTELSEQEMALIRNEGEIFAERFSKMFRARLLMFDKIIDYFFMDQDTTAARELQSWFVGDRKPDRLKNETGLDSILHWGLRFAGVPLTPETLAIYTDENTKWHIMNETMADLSQTLFDSGNRILRSMKSTNPNLLNRREILMILDAAKNYDFASILLKPSDLLEYEVLESEARQILEGAHLDYRVVQKDYSQKELLRQLKDLRQFLKVAMRILPSNEDNLGVAGIFVNEGTKGLRSRIFESSVGREVVADEDSNAPASRVSFFFPLPHKSRTREEWVRDRAQQFMWAVQGRHDYGQLWVEKVRSLQRMIRDSKGLSDDQFLTETDLAEWRNAINLEISKRPTHVKDVVESLDELLNTTAELIQGQIARKSIQANEPVNLKQLMELQAYIREVVNSRLSTSLIRPAPELEDKFLMLFQRNNVFKNVDVKTAAIQQKLQEVVTPFDDQLAREGDAWFTEAVQNVSPVWFEGIEELDGSKKSLVEYMKETFDSTWLSGKTTIYRKDYARADELLIRSILGVSLQRQLDAMKENCIDGAIGRACSSSREVEDVSLRYFDALGHLQKSWSWKVDQKSKDEWNPPLRAPDERVREAHWYPPLSWEAVDNSYALTEAETKEIVNKVFEIMAANRDLVATAASWEELVEKYHKVNWITRGGTPLVEDIASFLKLVGIKGNPRQRAASSDVYQQFVWLREMFLAAEMLANTRLGFEAKNSVHAKTLAHFAGLKDSLAKISEINQRYGISFDKLMDAHDRIHAEVVEQQLAYSEYELEQAFRREHWLLSPALTAVRSVKDLVVASFLETPRVAFRLGVDNLAANSILLDQSSSSYNLAQKNIHNRLTYWGQETVPLLMGDVAGAFGKLVGHEKAARKWGEAQGKTWSYFRDDLLLDTPSLAGAVAADTTYAFASAISFGLGGHAARLATTGGKKILSSRAGAAAADVGRRLLPTAQRDFVKSVVTKPRWLFTEPVNRGAAAAQMAFANTTGQTGSILTRFLRHRAAGGSAASFFVQTGRASAPLLSRFAFESSALTAFQVLPQLAIMPESLGHEWSTRTAELASIVGETFVFLYSMHAKTGSLGFLGRNTRPALRKGGELLGRANRWIDPSGRYSPVDLSPLNPAALAPLSAILIQNHIVRGAVESGVYSGVVGYDLYMPGKSTRLYASLPKDPTTGELKWSDGDLGAQERMQWEQDKSQFVGFLSGLSIVGFMYSTPRFSRWVNETCETGKCADTLNPAVEKTAWWNKVRDSDNPHMQKVVNAFRVMYPDPSRQAELGYKQVEESAFLFALQTKDVNRALEIKNKLLEPNPIDGMTPLESAYHDRFGRRPTAEEALEMKAKTEEAFQLGVERALRALEVEGANDALKDMLFAPDPTIDIEEMFTKLWPELESRTPRNSFISSVLKLIGLRRSPPTLGQMKQDLLSALGVPPEFLKVRAYTLQPDAARKIVAGYHLGTMVDGHFTKAKRLLGKWEVVESEVSEDPAQTQTIRRRPIYSEGENSEKSLIGYIYQYGNHIYQTTYLMDGSSLFSIMVPQGDFVRLIEIPVAFNNAGRIWGVDWKGSNPRLVLQTLSGHTVEIEAATGMATSRLGSSPNVTRFSIEGVLRLREEHFPDDGDHRPIPDNYAEVTYRREFP